MGKAWVVVLLIFSNVFMTYAWYGHLKDLKGKPLIVARAHFLLRRMSFEPTR